jgi:hypothetical protein
VPLLFSYGTLQLEHVQLSTFGRRIQGEQDELHGFELSFVAVEDPYDAAADGMSQFPIVRLSGRPDSQVSGVVFEVSDAELASADRYEGSNYRRIVVTLASGTDAWAYVPNDMPSIRVECYAGHRGEERPVRVSLGDRVVEVVEVLDQWLAPDHRYFKVRTAEGIFILRNDATSGSWELTAFRAA